MSELLTEFGKWGPAGLLLFLIAVGLFLYGKYFLLPRHKAEEARRDVEVATFHKLGETVAALGVVAGQTHQGVVTTLASSEELRSYMRVLMRVHRIHLPVFKKLSAAVQIDLDEELGEMRGVLDDGSAQMRALTVADEEAAKKRKGFV